MKPDTHTSKIKKAVNMMMIIGLVVAGAAVFALMNRGSSGGELMPTLFLVFFGAIITVQIIPGIVLMGSILKGLINLGRKQVPAEVSAHKDTHK